MKDLRYDAIANVDGNFLDAEYFSFLLERLAGDATLGVVGTAFRDPSEAATIIGSLASSTLRAAARCSEGSVLMRSAGMYPQGEGRWIASL